MIDNLIVFLGLLALALGVTYFLIDYPEFHLMLLDVVALLAFLITIYQFFRNRDS